MTVDAENFVALVISVVVGVYLLYCLFRPEDL
jgi:K+-transporting ATPase KdpF subunit